MLLHYSSRLVTIPQGSKVHLQDANTLPPEARKTCLDNDSMMIIPLVVYVISPFFLICQNPDDIPDKVERGKTHC